MLDKLQNYLKMKHKFDPKLNHNDRWEILTKWITGLKAADMAGNKPEIKKNMGNLLIELIKLANLNEVDLNKVLSDDFKLNL